MRNKYPFVMQKLEVCTNIPKQTQIHFAHFIGVERVFTSLVELKPNDSIWIDVRNGNVEIVERGGIAIWRSGWLN